MACFLIINDLNLLTSYLIALYVLHAVFFFCLLIFLFSGFVNILLYCRMRFVRRFLETKGKNVEGFDGVLGANWDTFIYI